MGPEEKEVLIDNNTVGFHYSCATRAPCESTFFNGTVALLSLVIYDAPRPGSPCDLLRFLHHLSITSLLFFNICNIELDSSFT